MGNRGLAVLNKEIVVFQQQHEDFGLEMMFVPQYGKAGDYVISDNIGHYIASEEKFKVEYEVLMENVSDAEINAWAGLNVDDIEETYTETGLETGVIDPDYINRYKVDNSEDESKSV